MSEAIWLAGSSLPRKSREVPRAWLDRFLSNSGVRPEWITAAHVIQPKAENADPGWNLPILPFCWTGGATQAHFLLAALCRELRTGGHELALMLEKDSAGWNATLLATPAFFGARNRIPAVMITETGVFPQAEPAVRSSEQAQFLQKSSLSPLPETISLSPAAWLNGAAWSEAAGLVRALNAASAVISKEPGKTSALRSAVPDGPTLITLLEGL